MVADAGVFFGLWLQRPLQIAAVCPSSTRAATKMARLVDLARPGPILELGAGTGSLTRGLLRAGCPPNRLIVFEREERLVAILQRQFRGVTAIGGDAVELDRHLDELGIDRLSTVVSSLPIKWFPLELQRAIVQPCLTRLGPGGRFLQLTNAFASPLPIAQLGIAGRQVARVWPNLPPAQIWSYTERTAPSDRGNR
jgi:phosphatidylethanolamine/phosphatidyl-N-methylethanolamine N-methyltransferase